MSGEADARRLLAALAKKLRSRANDEELERIGEDT